MVKDKHIRVIHGATFPLTLLCFEKIVEPHSISVRIRFIALIISSRISLVVFIVNLMFTSAAVRLQTIPVA
jgi:hypothetical protein